MTNSREFFGGCRTIEELKAEYKRLAKIHHPDCGGDDATMARINAEYDRLSQVLPKTNAQGETYQPQQREAPAAFRAAVLAAINLKGVTVELCGVWLWVTGDTRPYKDILKAAGYRWSANKSAWYWHEEGYVKYGKKHYSMDEIRAMHGSSRVVAAKRDELPETAA